MKRKTQQACLIAFGAVLGLLLLPPLLGEFYFGTDATVFDLGKICETQSLLRNGQSLLLAPHLGNSEPLLGDPQSLLFYPLRWPLLLLSPAWAASLGPALNLALGAAAAAWLGRTFRLSRSGAAATGMAFALSGPTLDLLRHTTYAVGAMVLPLAWASSRRILQGSRGIHLPILLACALAGGLLGAEPQSVAIALVLIAAEALWRRKKLGRRWVTIALASVSGLAMGMTAWVGALSELALTARGLGAIRKEVGTWALEPSHWPGVLLPGALSERLTSNTSLWNLLHHGVAERTWDLSPYWGALLFASALAGWTIRRLRLVAIILTLATLASMGDTLAPAGAVLRLLPVINSFRYAEKYWVVATLSAVILAMVALERATRSARLRRVMLWTMTTTLSFAFVALGAVFLGASDLDRMAPPDHSDFPTLSRMLAGSLVQTVIPLAAATFALSRQRGVLRAYLGWLIVADLLIAGPAEIAAGPRLDDVHSPLAGLPGRADRPAMVCHDEALHFSVRAAGDTSEWTTELYVRALSQPDSNACDGVTAGVPYSLLNTSVSKALADALATGHDDAARALGCTHIVSQRAPLEPGWNRIGVEGLDDMFPLERGGAAVFEVPGPLPAAFVIPNPILIESQDEAINRLVDETNAVADLRIVDDPLRHLPAARLPSGATTTARPTARWDGPTRLTLDLSGSGGGVVGFLSAFHAGWTAHQGGRELPVVRVSGNQVGAAVEELGGGPIVFEYLLPNRFVAFACFVVGAIALAMSVIYSGDRPA